MDRGTTDRHLFRQEVAALNVVAVRSNRIDLAGLVTAVNEAVAAGPAAPGSDHHDVSLQNSPFALHAEQPGSQIEDKVVPLVVEGSRNAKSELEGEGRDLRLRECPFLIRRQHGQQVSRVTGRNVVRPGDRSV